MEPLKTTSLIHAINFWINYERLCKRSVLFSEKYLSVPIGEYLIGHYGKSAQIEHYYKYASESGKNKVRGFLIDYVVVENKKMKIAIETKWVQTKYNVDRIFKDLFRLSIVKRQNPDCECYFIMTGKKSDLYELIKEVNAQDIGLTKKKHLLPRRKARKWMIKNALLKGEKEILDKSLIGIDRSFLPKVQWVIPIISKVKNLSKNEIKVLSWKVSKNCRTTSESN
jgi:hypothetical protein